MRILHTMLRVTDLERSLNFYTQVLGMRELRRKESAEGGYTLVFVGYCDESDGSVIELMYAWESKAHASIAMHTAFGHIGLAVADIYASCQAIKAQGGKIVREPRQAGEHAIAFIEDPDGYEIELIQRD